MAQGGAKLGKAKKSAGSQRRKQTVKKTAGKGRKAYKAKGRKGVVEREKNETTKAINKKNEALVSARAVGSGDRFFLKDIRETGKKEIDELKKEQYRKENRAAKVTDRLKIQLKKLGRDVE
mmetsp:Transcript_7848/g.11292  ORF Transcript_7848/g.11292 Transcript_7848/m.11292 type:complete len:121 (-) Transcript_7848:230-592(-)